MDAHTYTNTTHAHAHMHTHIQSMHAHVHTHTNTYAHAQHTCTRTQHTRLESASYVPVDLLDPLTHRIISGCDLCITHL